MNEEMDFSLKLYDLILSKTDFTWQVDKDKSYKLFWESMQRIGNPSVKQVHSVIGFKEIRISNSNDYVQA